MPKNKEFIKIYKSDFDTYKRVQKLLSSEPNDKEEVDQDKHQKKSTQSYFVRPTVANDNIRHMLKSCLDAGQTMDLKHTVALEDGNVMTCQSDVRLILTTYLGMTNAITKDVVMINDFLWDCMTVDFRCKMIEKKDLIVDNGTVYFVRKNKGIVSSIASDIMKN